MLNDDKIYLFNLPDHVVTLPDAPISAYYRGLEIIAEELKAVQMYKIQQDVEIEYAVCTNCKQHGEFYMRYCPNCGARMESDKR